MIRFFRQTFPRDDGSSHEEEMIGIPRGDFDESVHIVTDEDRQMYREEYAAFLKPPETADELAALPKEP